MKGVFNRIAVFGLGLLGGSLCRRIKKDFPSARIVACERSLENVKQALEEGVVDEITTADKVNLAGADLIVVAVPVVTSVKLILNILSRDDLENNALVIDVGSVKESILKAVKAHPRSAQFLGCHPMAGSERSGYGASSDSLYEGSRVIITPHERNTEKTISEIRSFWQHAGATVRIMSSEDHDRLVAMTSHVPHLMSTLLVSMVRDSMDVDEAIDLRDVIGKGFTGMTRVAVSSSEMWRDIVVLNRRHISSMLDVCISELASLKEIVDLAGETDDIFRYFEEMKKFREELI